MVRILLPSAGVMSEPQTIRAQDGRGGWTRAGIGLASDQRTTDQARKAAAGLPWLASGAVRRGEHPPELRHQRLSGAPLTDRRPVVVDLIEKLFFRMGAEDRCAFQLPDELPRPRAPISRSGPT
jgi:hypothetical protein